MKEGVKGKTRGYFCYYGKTTECTCVIRTPYLHAERETCYQDKTQK